MVLNKVEINRLEKELISDSEVWLEKATNCPTSLINGRHELIPISWTRTERTEHVQMLMCLRCFHEINISDAFRYRVKL